MEEWLTYDQITLIPTQVSTLGHRADADTSVKLGDIALKVPIIAAPMPDVSNGKMAISLEKLGSFGWIHRFQTVKEMMAELKSEVNTVGVAFSLTHRPVDVEEFYKLAGIRVFCIDTANGASAMVERAIKTLKDKYPDIFIIAGNIASLETFRELESWGADAIRVGIAGGSVCETRTETGIYSPMATIIQQCANRPRVIIQPVGSGGPIDALDQYKDIGWKHKALVIADGGIKKPADMIKALALGADLVMMGGALAGTAESPGRVIVVDGKKFKVLRGAASFGVQKEAGTEDINYVEGAETLVPYVGSVEKVISRYAAGLRSAMSYFNARDLTEFRKNVKIVRCQ